MPSLGDSRSKAQKGHVCIQQGFLTDYARKN